MASYLLSCECGKTVPVDVGQAGGTAVCDCGKHLEVPTLRQLRHLPKSEDPPTAGRPAKPWDARHGLVAAGSIGMIALLAWSGYVWWFEPKMQKFDLAARLKTVEEEIQTPAGAWKAWVEFYRPMAEKGIPEFRMMNADQIDRAIAQSRFVRFTLWALAFLCGFIALCGTLWPKQAR